MQADFPSAQDLLSLWNADKQGAEGPKNAGPGFEDVLNGLHNNMMAAPTPFSQTVGSQQGQPLVQPSPQHLRHPSSSGVTHIQAAMSCDIELLDVAELPSNPPGEQQPQHAPVIPPPVNLSQADMAGFHYAEPNYFAAGMGMPGMMGHAFHHGLAMHPALAHQQAQMHAAMHPGLAAWQQPLLGNPAIVLTRPGMQLQSHPAAAAAAAAAVQQQQQQVAAAQAAAQQQAAAAAHAAAAKAAAQQQQQQAPGAPARAGSGGATDSGASGALDRPGSPSFLQAALAILKSNEAQGTARSGADSAGGNKSSSSGAGGAGTPRSALPLGTVASGTPFGLAPGLQVAGMQQFAGMLPAGVAGQQLGAAKGLGGVSDGCSVPDDDDDYSDDQGVTPCAGSGDAGRAGAQGGSRKGQARPRTNINFDALVDPNLPPEEARRMRRMLSNRESARRSRRRRQTHLSELESQVEQLKTEKEKLASELSSTSQQMRAVVAEKQRLQLEVEALRRKLSHMAPVDLEAGQADLTAAALLQPQQASGPFSALPPQPPPQQPVVQESSEAQEQVADDLLQSEWGRFGVALGGFSRPPLDPAGSQQAQHEQMGGGRTSLDGGRKLTRPASMHRIPSMEQMCKKAKDRGDVCGPLGGACPTEQLAHAHSPPTVLEGLPDDLLAGTPSFGL